MHLAIKYSLVFTLLNLLISSAILAQGGPDGCDDKEIKDFGVNDGGRSYVTFTDGSGTYSYNGEEWINFDSESGDVWTSDVPWGPDNGGVWPPSDEDPGDDGPGEGEPDDGPSVPSGDDEEENDEGMTAAESEIMATYVTFIELGLNEDEAWQLTQQVSGHLENGPSPNRLQGWDWDEDFAPRTNRNTRLRSWEWEEDLKLQANPNDSPGPFRGERLNPNDSPGP
ncbi:MAG TPA: hypothetical protein DCY79_09795 [Planctomycetaceae bacterium]|jgi:hypothetical protein|nr:hypothetical protein [Blastopirellula sp.]HAY80082.1 hypothetical protein [Planctomycetaceae bacterium]